MIRTTAVARSVRIGAAAVGIAGALALAGCAGTPTAEQSEPVADETTQADEPTSEATAGTGEDASAGDSVYADGTYTADGAYTTPETVETISVTVTLEDDVITAVEVTGDPQTRESEQYQGEFIGGISDVVVGRSIDEISVSRVAGSSLTSNGFNEAIDSITSEAAA